jgi:hypothetical protein
MCDGVGHTCASLVVGLQVREDSSFRQSCNKINDESVQVCIRTGPKMHRNKRKTHESGPLSKNLLNDILKTTEKEKKKEKVAANKVQKKIRNWPWWLL